MNVKGFNREDEHIFHRYFDLRLFISLGAAIMPVVIPLFIWGIGVESRLVVQQEQIKALVEDQRRQDERYTAVTTAMREDMREMNRKLDRLIEGQSSNRGR